MRKIWRLVCDKIRIMKQLQNIEDLKGKVIAEVEVITYGDHGKQILIFTDSTYAVFGSNAGYEDSEIYFEKDFKLKPDIWYGEKSEVNEIGIKLGLFTQEDVERTAAEYEARRIEAEQFRS